MKEVLEKIKIVPPETLSIIGPLKDDRETHIAIHNPLKQLIAFKIKTTRLVSVKPRYGYIPGKREIFIKVKAPGLESCEEVSSRETVKITLAAVQSSKAPAKAQDVWKEDAEPQVMLTHTLKIVFKLEDETISSADDDSTASERRQKSQKSQKNEKSEMSEKKSNRHHLLQQQGGNKS